MVIQANGTAPYAPPKTLIDVITRYRDRGLSKPFDQEVLARAGVPESLAPRVLQALRLLELIDEEGNPSQQFEDIARAPQAEFQERFSSLIRTVYADVFMFADPAADEPDRVRDAFRSYNPRGQQERMVTLFLGLCQFAGIIEEVPKRAPSPSSRRNSPTGPVSRPKSGGSSARGRKGKGTSPHLGEHDVLPSRLPLLFSLLGELPEAGRALSQADRSRFRDLFDTLLDFYFPLQEQAAMVESEVETEEEPAEEA